MFTIRKVELSRQLEKEFRYVSVCENKGIISFYNREKGEILLRSFAITVRISMSKNQFR